MPGRITIAWVTIAATSVFSALHFLSSNNSSSGLLTSKVHGETTCGSMRGVLLKGNGKGPESEVRFAAFRGIPFGAPTDQPRWQPPRDAECWEAGVEFDATKYGHSCMQWFPGVPSAVTKPLLHMSEDCLNLDLYTPAVMKRGRRYEVVSDAKLPVVVWIAGGGNFVASSSLYGPVENLVSLSGGRVVLASVNYRTNVFGFAALPELDIADPRGVSGNYGLLDIQLSLKWLQTNAGRLGGDASRVTLLGQSAGGSNIVALYTMPSNVGLFHAAISLSGSPALYTNATAKHAMDRQEWIAHTPCAGKSGSDLLSCLRGASFEDLTKSLPLEWSESGNTFPTDASHLGWPGGGILKGWRQWAHVDGVTVTQSSVDAFRDGPMSRLAPLLLQSMNAEDSPNNFCQLAGLSCDTVGKDTDPTTYSVDQLHAFWSDFLDPGFDIGTGDEVFDMYYASRNSTKSPKDLYYEADSDTALACGHLALAASASASNRSAPIYVSVVESTPSPPIRTLPCVSAGNDLAFHGWDLIMALRLYDHGTPGLNMASMLCPGYTPTEDTKRVGDLMLQQWLQMAEQQQLNSSVGWPGFDEEKQTLGVFHDGKLDAVERGRQDVCGWWRSKGVGEQWWWD